MIWCWREGGLEGGRTNIWERGNETPGPRIDTGFPVNNAKLNEGLAAMSELLREPD